MHSSEKIDHFLADRLFLGKGSFYILEDFVHVSDLLELRLHLRSRFPLLFLHQVLLLLLGLANDL